MWVVNTSLYSVSYGGYTSKARTAVQQALDPPSEFLQAPFVQKMRSQGTLLFLEDTDEVTKERFPYVTIYPALADGEMQGVCIVCHAPVNEKGVFNGEGLAATPINLVTDGGDPYSVSYVDPETLDIRRY